MRFWSLTTVEGGWAVVDHNPTRRDPLSVTSAGTHTSTWKRWRRVSRSSLS